MLRTTIATTTVVLATAALSACGTSSPAAPTIVTETVTVPAPTSPASAGTDLPTPNAPAPASWTMPDLVGTGLQEAQNTIQRLTSYGISVTTSHDATGAQRMQVSDRNWKVCTQNVPAGTTITSDTSIDFGTVKLEEDC